MTIDKYDGVLELGARKVRIVLDTESGWVSEDAPELAALLNVECPYPPRPAGLSGYDPNPAYTVLMQAAEWLEATVIQEPEIDRDEGVIY